MSERWITARELAEQMGVSVATVTRWTRDGAPSETWGMRVRRFQLSKVVAWKPLRDRLLTLPRESEWVFTTLRGHHYVPSTRAQH